MMINYTNLWCVMGATIPTHLQMVTLLAFISNSSDLPLSNSRK